MINIGNIAFYFIGKFFISSTNFKNTEIRLEYYALRTVESIAYWQLFFSFAHYQGECVPLLTKKSSCLLLER